MTRPFGRIAASLYLQEAFELCHSLLYRLDRVEEARDRWVQGQDAADAQLRSAVDDFDTQQFNDGLSSSSAAQGEIFAEVESFLASWARLSLLFWPEPRGKKGEAEFTRARGIQLRAFLQIDDTHALYDRALRNAWMHTDERFDAAWSNRTLGNRQTFVRTNDVASAVAFSVRVVDVETLTVHFRDDRGEHQARALRPLKAAILDVIERRSSAFRLRLRELPDDS